MRNSTCVLILISSKMWEFSKQPFYLLYILQAAGVWFQGGGVLHHFVHCDDQEDEIELSKQSNGSVNK